MSAADFEKYVAEAGIRDAVAFQEESSDANNHFVSLIINIEARALKGQGSGANPRTVKGQRLGLHIDRLRRQLCYTG